MGLIKSALNLLKTKKAMAAKMAPPDAPAPKPEYNQGMKAYKKYLDQANNF